MTEPTTPLYLTYIRLAQNPATQDCGQRDAALRLARSTTQLCDEFLEDEKAEDCTRRHLRLRGDINHG